MLQGRQDAKLLYDSRQVEIVEDRRITQALHAFDEEIAHLSLKIASVTSDYTIATRVGLIHVSSPHHERFYDLESARQWLRLGST